jgi:Transcriptional regulators
METHQLDKTDLQLLKILQENGRISIKELAQRVHLSPTPVFDRVRRLESTGVIERYTARPKRRQTGPGLPRLLQRETPPDGQGHRP